MSMNLDAIGQTWESGEHTWTSKDAILYALGVGAGAQDPLAELSFTTENSHGVTQQVLPTFVVVIGGGGGDQGPKLGDFDFSQVLHAEQSIRLEGPLPVNGRVRSTSRLVNIYDKGSGALAVLESSIVAADTGRPVAQVSNGIFVRGEGGFGGERGTSAPWERPDRPADRVVVYPTRSDQALLYRLSGDRNPLHSDPWFAARAGFERPILHGLCTYGFTGRALLHALCGSDPAAFGGMSARFAAPVMPGQDLAVHIWDDGRFVTKVGDTVVLDRGVFTRAER
ncbi:MaoC/PaaZ C-terminal domain-containing protein [Nonomuraea jabiensis]|uniref:Acyl dehydratase n=1 Tax=Nonomuraea jabiensis TaxID=882448 RepID=A0A7W9GA24_9ACTN|nr:MaoC family dehydratase [Nonomuraea jabiensis]MBB5779970.1 acyl dehydratase [Nonomuraea jabiensis]